MKNQPLQIRLLLSIGLLLVVLPAMISDFIKFPDFLRGLLIGIGLTMEIGAIIKMKGNNHSRPSC